MKRPEDVQALLLLGGALLDEGKADEAGRTLAQALAIQPKSAATNDALGGLLLAQHHDPEAMDRFETVLATSPQDGTARKGEVAAATELALTARREGHPELALEALRHAGAALPDDPQLLLDRGIQAEEIGALREAEQALHAALALDGKNPTVLYALARVETDEQHMLDAERDMRAYLALRPDDASAHFGLGHIEAMLQRSADAQGQFEVSIRLQPRQTESYYQLGELDLQAHLDVEAKPLFEEVLASDPNHAGALTGMGELAFRAKDYAAAEQWLARAEQADPSYMRPHYYRGLALARLGRKAEAGQELQHSDGREHATHPPKPDVSNASPLRPADPQPE